VTGFWHRACPFSNRREVVVPLNKIKRFGDDGVRLDLTAPELAGFGLFDAPSLRPMPDHWPMPAGERVGEVEGVEVDHATGRISRVIVRRGRLFRTETAIPAGVIASVADDRITLGVGADELNKLEPGPIGQLGRARAS
jgi:hypothetical protein